MESSVERQLQRLLILLALCACAPGFSEAQTLRFPPLTDCLRDNSLSCVACDTRVTVDPVQGMDCRPTMQQGNSGSSLKGRVCLELDDVLSSVAKMDTVHEPGGCIEVVVMPKGMNEAYRVIDDPNRVIRQSVVLRGAAEAEQGVRVTLVRFGEGSNTDGVEYAVMFRDSELVGVMGVWFDGSLGRVGIEEVNVVVIENSVFQYFSQGALDVYNSPTVIVMETEFLHNGPFLSQLLQEYRGDSAGLSVAINQAHDIPLLLRVHNCTFHNNSVGSVVMATATVTPNVTSDPTQGPPPPNQGGSSSGGGPMGPPSREEMFQAIGGVVVGLQFTSRGGGLAVIVNDEDPAEVEVWGCEFSDNEALAFGGGMYVGLDGMSRHSVVINQTIFSNNTSPSTGGGLHMSFLKAGQPGFDNSVSITDTLFTDNVAQYGGGVYFLPLDIDVNALEGDAQLGVFVRFERCLFIGNHASEVGGAFGGAFHILAFNTKPLAFTDCSFEGNSVGGSGIVSTAFYPLSFQGNNTFINNRGASLSVIGSRVRVSGSLLFRDNSNLGGVQDQGAMYVTSQGQIELTAGATLSFVNNSGITGAGLYVEAPHVPGLFSQLVANPLCVFLFEEDDLSPSLWRTRNVSLEFRDNKARVASAVYINNLDLCSWSPLSHSLFSKRSVFYWSFINYTGNVNTVHGDSTDPQWAVQTPPIGLDVTTREGSYFPGQRINLFVTGLDELGSPTSVSARLSDTSENEMLQFQPSSVTPDRVNTRSPVSYLNPFSEGNVERRRVRIRATSLLQANRRITAKSSFSISTRSCPAGLKLLSFEEREGYSVCECDEERSEIITCNGRLITLNTHLWGSADSSLNTFPCPEGYCRCIVSRSSGQYECNFIFDPDSLGRQCNCNRTGVLCGECAEGTGFSVLLNRCVSCDSLFYLLIPLLVIVDTAVIVFLLIVMVPAPSWLYPALCYLQLLPHFTEFFPVSFELVRPYLYYVASAIGLYFPYDFCLSYELDAVGAHSLRYLPPLLATVLSVAVILVRSKLMRPRQWHGVWWLVLLLYTPAVYTSLSALYCPVIPAEGPPVPRWHLNGNVRCFNGTHIPLGLLAIFVLFCCVALIPICILVSLKKLPFPRWVRFLEEPLTHAYKDKCAWWSGLELGKRLVLILFSVIFPNNDYGLILTLIIVIAVCSYVKPYKKLGTNLLDVFLSCDVLILLMLRNTVYLEDVYQVITQDIVHTEQLVSGPQSPVNEDQLLSALEQCGSSFTGITTMVAILTPFYYLPLALAVGTLLVWSIYHLSIHIYGHCRSRTGTIKRGRSTVRSPTEEARPRTQTVVDVDELDAEPSNVNGSDEGFELKPRVSTTELLSCVPEKKSTDVRTNGTHRDTQDSGISENAI